MYLKSKYVTFIWSILHWSSSCKTRTFAISSSEDSENTDSSESVCSSQAEPYFSDSLDFFSRLWFSSSDELCPETSRFSLESPCVISELSSFSDFSSSESLLSERSSQAGIFWNPSQEFDLHPLLQTPQDVLLVHP